MYIGSCPLHPPWLGLYLAKKFSPEVHHAAFLPSENLVHRTCSGALYIHRNPTHGLPSMLSIFFIPTTLYCGMATAIKLLSFSRTQTQGRPPVGLTKLVNINFLYQEEWPRLILAQ